MTHLSHEEIAAYVMGTASLDEQRKSHVLACPRCSARLAEEARLEVMVRDSMIGRTEATPRASASSRIPLAWVAVITLLVTSGSVAILALLVARVSPPPPPPPARMAEVVSAEDVPCLIDPLTYAPGYTVGPVAPGYAVPALSDLSFR